MKPNKEIIEELKKTYNSIDGNADIFVGLY